MQGIEINNLTKQYKDIRALDGVSIKMEHGKIYGLLGRNGAGKSTLLNIVTNRLFATTGTVMIDGMPAAENDHAQRRVYMMSEPAYYPRAMRFREVMKWTGEFYKGAFDAEQAGKLSERFGLSHKKKMGELSTGYASIAKIILALSLDVPYVLLDEPVLGLDAHHRDLFYKLLLATYAQKPKTIVLSTHLIEEVAAVIEEVIVIKKGKVLVQQSVEQMLSAGYTVTGSAQLVETYVAGKQTIGIETIGGLKVAYVLGILDRPKVPAGIEVSRIDLQKLFVQMTTESP